MIVKGRATDITYRPVGIIYTPFKEPRGTPIQPAAAAGVNGKVVIFPEYAEGLKDLEGFSHVILIYHFHLIRRSMLRVRPFLDDEMHGVFCTRAPCRPNPIGISVVRLKRLEGNVLHVQDVDIVNETPLLDIKPYVPEFDVRAVEKTGWLEKNARRFSEFRDDGRFVE